LDHGPQRIIIIYGRFLRI